MGKPKKHKRKGPKSTRSGCLLCKPHKRQGVKAPTMQERRALYNCNVYEAGECLGCFVTPRCPLK